jgi:hypothetical protein
MTRYDCDMLPRLAAHGLLAIALLQAQQLTDVEPEFLTVVGNALSVHPGAVIADVGTASSPTWPIPQDGHRGK